MEVEAPIEFKVITYDGTSENLIKLVKLKNIFRKQLPKIAGEYIVRLVWIENTKV